MIYPYCVDFEDKTVVGEVGKRLIQLLQRTKDISFALKEPSKRIRPALSQKVYFFGMYHYIHL